MNCRIMLMAGALAFAAACQDAPTESSVAQPAAAPPSLTLYNASTKTLGVQLHTSNNGSNPLQEGELTATASVTGGTQPYRRYFYLERCSTAVDCGGMNLISSSTGQDTSATFYVYAEDAYIRVKVLVEDSSTDGMWTGSYQRNMMGPAY